jgi:transposase
MPVKNILCLRLKTVCVVRHVEFKHSSKEIGKCFRVSPRTVRKFKERTAKSLKLYSKDGRPPSIDSESEVAIIEWMVANKGFNRTELQKEIMQECKQTYMRKHPDYVCNDKRKKNFASRHTIYRWYKYFTFYFNDC